jgi:BirA family biotin operon repressor/biotin-[acetyl-CoA-carboxylase] ligase
MYIASTNSTNTLLKELIAKGEWPNGERFIRAGYQTAGRGQTGNGWESEADKNLLCSILLPPNKNLHFLNIAVSVAVRRIIGEDFTIKWPNDIYWKDKKVAGILVENAIVGSEVKYSIAGIGLNVNQTEFKSDAPNPISLKQIYGTDFVVDELMQKLYAEVQRTWEEDVWAEYKSHLYRREGFWPFEDKNGKFEAAIQDVLPTGEIVLRDANGQIRQYEFKQIKYIL